MEFEKLFQVLVVSGSVMVGGCAAKTPAATPTSDAPQVTKSEDTTLDCEAICDHLTDDRDSVCPDPSVGAQNCCWLMSELHECCP